MRAWADQVSFGVCQAGLNIASALVCNLRRIGVLDQVQHRSCLFDPFSEKYLSENHQMVSSYVLAQMGRSRQDANDYFCPAVFSRYRRKKAFDACSVIFHAR